MAEVKNREGEAAYADTDTQKGRDEVVCVCDEVEGGKVGEGSGLGSSGGRKRSCLCRIEADVRC